MKLSSHVAFARTILPLTTASLLTACGGGGGSSAPSPPPPPPPAFTIGGTVSGLTAGAVVLRNNSGNDLSITANGAFTFPTPVAGGANYAVTVANQPPGPDCAVTAGAGSANANVTNVAVICTADPATVFVPLIASQDLAPTELHVVTSKAIARPPIRVATDWQFSYGFTMNFSRDGAGKLVANKPAALIYSAGPAGSAGNIYALDLSAGSSLVPRQVGNLPPAALNGIVCESWLAFGDVDDPASAFLLLGLPTDPSYLCGGGNFAMLRVRLSDSPATAPAPVANLPAGSKQFIYRPDGVLAGVVVCDYATRRLMMYHDDTFTTSTTLLNGCVTFGVVQPETVPMLNNLVADPTYAFIHVYMEDGSMQLYRVGHTRTISAMLYDQQGDPFDGLAIDDQYLYFSDRISEFPTVQSFLRVRLDGTAAAQPLYSYSIPDGDTGLTLRGEIGSKLLLMRGLTIDPVTGARSSDLRTVNKTGSATASIIATYTDGALWVWEFEDLLFVNVPRVLPGFPTTLETDTEVRTIDGTLVQPLLADSSFTGAGAGRMLRSRQSVLGGTLSTRFESLAVQPNQTLGATILKRSDGGDYALPGTAPYSFTFGISPTIGVGNASAGNDPVGLLFDIPKATIETIALPNKRVSFVTGY